MAENNQASNGREVATKPEAAPVEGDKQSMLLKLAERTVLQAEALAKEIGEHARQESEAEGARILAELREQAKSEAQQITEAAQRESEILLNAAAAEVLSTTEKALSKANPAWSLRASAGTISSTKGAMNRPEPSMP